MAGRAQPAPAAKDRAEEVSKTDELRRQALSSLLAEWIPEMNEVFAGNLRYHEKQKREGLIGAEIARVRLEMAAVLQRALEERLAALEVEPPAP